jgi:SAM-dependent methyltransferase
MPLAQWIDDQPKLLGDTWLDGLEPRKQEEASFHDADREDHRDEKVVEGNRRFYDAADPPRRHLSERVAALSRGSVALDYACGNGKMTLQMAKAGAELAVGIDISETSVRNSIENAAAAGFSSKTRFLQRDCESTQFPDASFDFVLCSGMLHHLDLNRAFPELHRILRPGGRVFCAEALNYNPFIKLYRRMTPQYRTDWEAEHILSMRDVRFAERWFSVENLRFFCMAAPLGALMPSGPLRRAVIGVGHSIDSVLTRTPVVRLWSWQFMFELVKS